MEFLEVSSGHDEAAWQKDAACGTAFVADVCMLRRFSLSEVLHKNNVTIQRIQLCVQNCLLVWRDSQSRRF